MSDFVRAASVDEIGDNDIKVVELDDRVVIVCRRGDQFYCIDDICTHDGGTLSDGDIEGDQIICPRHGARFDLRTGEALTMPATEDVPAHEVRIYKLTLAAV